MLNRFFRRAIVPVTLSTLATLAAAQPQKDEACRNWRSLDSVPGQQWWASNRWRYLSDDGAEAAYQRLAGDEPSPWPAWFEPKREELTVGTRFQMALGAYQSAREPGGFGTFDDLAHVEDVRSGLAVKEKWKPLIDRVVTYEVTRLLPVHVGPIGPQLDEIDCRLLPGRWTQIQMLVPRDERMLYLRIVSISLFRPVEVP